MAWTTILPEVVNSIATRVDAATCPAGYLKDKVLWHDGDLYQCQEDITAETAWTDATKLKPVVLADLMGKAEGDFLNETAAADEYTKDAAYSIGDFVVNNGDLYQAKVNIASAPETMVAADWTKVQLDDFIDTFPVFVAGRRYGPNNIVFHEGKFYKYTATYDQIESSWRPGYWKECSRFNFGAGAGLLVSREWQAGYSYSKDTYFWYKGVLYKTTSYMGARTEEQGPNFQYCNAVYNIIPGLEVKIDKKLSRERVASEIDYDKVYEKPTLVYSNWETDPDGFNALGVAETAVKKFSFKIYDPDVEDPPETGDAYIIPGYYVDGDFDFSDSTDYYDGDKVRLTDTDGKVKVYVVKDVYGNTYASEAEMRDSGDVIRIGDYHVINKGEETSSYSTYSFKDFDWTADNDFIMDYTWSQELIDDVMTNTYWNDSGSVWARMLVTDQDQSINYFGSYRNLAYDAHYVVLDTAGNEHVAVTNTSMDSPYDSLSVESAPDAATTFTACTISDAILKASSGGGSGDDKILQGAKAWSDSTAYHKDDIVQIDDKLYISKVDDSTVGTFVPAEWDRYYISAASGSGSLEAGHPWDSTTQYHKDDIVQKDDKLWICNADDSTTGTFVTTEWDRWYVHEGGSAGNYADAAAVAPEYTPGTGYAAGKLVMHDHKLYKSAEAIDPAPAVFDPTKWNETNIVANLSGGGGGGDDFHPEITKLVNALCTTLGLTCTISGTSPDTYNFTFAYKPFN